MQVAEPCPTQYEPLDKDAVEVEVLAKVKLVGPFREDVVVKEVTYFFHDLGLHHYYFSALSTEMIANHVLSLIGNKLLAKTSGSAWVYEQLGISLAHETANIATFAAKSNVSTVATSSFPRPFGVHSSGSTVAVHHAQITESRSPSDKLEHFLETNYFAEGVDEPTSSHLSGGKTYEQMHKENSELQVRSKRRFRLQSFLSSGVLDPDDPVNLKIFMLQAPDFQDPNPPAGAYTIDRVSDKGFFLNASSNLKRQTQSLLSRSAEQRLGPVVSVETWNELREEGAETGRLLILYTHGSTHSYFTGVSSVYRYHGLYSVRKYVEQFSNAKTMYNIYLRKLSASQIELPVLMQRVANDCMLHYVLPRTSISGMLETGTLSPSEHAYAYCAWKFVYHFGCMTSSLHRAKRGSLRTAREVATELLDISEVGPPALICTFALHCLHCTACTLHSSLTALCTSCMASQPPQPHP
jgi:glutamate dehydrogenase